MVHELLTLPFFARLLIIAYRRNHLFRLINVQLLRVAIFRNILNESEATRTRGKT